MKQFNEWYSKLENYLAGSLIAIGLIILLIQVVMRYFLSLPTTWQDESARYLIIWGVLLGSAVAIRDNQHIKVDVLYEFLSNRWKTIVDIVSNIIVLIF